LLQAKGFAKVFDAGSRESPERKMGLPQEEPDIIFLLMQKTGKFAWLLIFCNSLQETGNICNKTAVNLSHYLREQPYRYESG
jgi:hypothetical protein